MADYADRHNERIAKMGKAGGFGKRRRVSRRGAPSQYDEAARAERRGHHLALVHEIKHNLARSDMRGPRRTALLAEIWQAIRYSLALIDWRFTLDVTDALDDDWPDDVTLTAINVFVEAGWLMRRTRAGEPLFRSHVRLAPKQAAEARRQFDVTGERGLVIREL